MRPRAVRLLLLSLGLASLCTIPGSGMPEATHQAAESAVALSAPESEIALRVTEYGGIARADEPVTTGIPIAAGQADPSWALFDGAQEIPVQVTVLPHRTVPWLLLDFQTSLAPSQVRSLTLRRQPGSASPAGAVTIVEDAQRITVTTGRLRTEVGRAVFNLFDRVWFDRDGNGAFSMAEQVVGPTPASNLSARDGGTGASLSGRGTPRRIEWEYRGPLRATLRVDGSYTSGPDSLLDYTTRLTWYAGGSWVRVDHTLRNSLALRERYVKVSSARLAIGDAATTARVPRPGAFVWSQVPGTGAALEMIPPSLLVSTAYAPYASPPVSRVGTIVDVDLNGGLIIGDLSHHGAIWQVDFADLTAAERARRAAAGADPLVALTPAARYAALGAFGLERPSSYDDEKDAYRRWGWTWPTAGNPWSREHDMPRVPGLYPSWSVLDATNDPEADELWQNVVMFTRVQIPFHLDRLRAWARYMRSEWAVRTDGFDYAGGWGGFYDGPGTTSREPILKPPLTLADSAYIEHNIRYGKAGVSHLWNGGLLDVYYLTGERDALEAAIDVAEHGWRLMAWMDVFRGSAGGNSRFQARCLLALTRLWEATGEMRWKNAADHVASFFVGSRYYDARGFFYGPIRDMGAGFASRFSQDAKLVTPFMMTAVVEGLYRYHLATDDPAVRAQLLQIAVFARDHALDPATGYGGDQIVVDSPQAGDVQHMSRSEFNGWTTTNPYSAAKASASFINALVIGYRLTGDRTFLDRAKRCWNQASKRHSTAPYDQVFATETQVGRFANSLQGGSATSLMFPEGDFPAVSLLFGEAARVDSVAPGRIQDLRRE